MLLALGRICWIFLGVYFSLINGAFLGFPEDAVVGVSMFDP
jgi:hypothetical protein